MKKLLAFLVSANLVAVSATSLVACEFYKLDPRIWLITTGGFINDKSFNESAFQGSGDYILTSTHDKYEYPSYYQPSDIREKNAEQGFRIAKQGGAQIGVLPGFTFAPYLKSASKILPKSFIVDYPAPQGLNNVSGITFSAQESGFYAGLLSALYFNALGQKTTYKIGGFMGGDSPAGVDNYMLGYLSAFAMWNQGVSDLKNSNPKPHTWDSVLANLIKNYQTLSSGTASAWTTADKSKLKAKFVLTPYQGTEGLKAVPKNSTTPSSLKYGGTNQNWFTNSFAPGKGKVISQTLLADGANLVFPVAGLQTADTVSAVNTKYPSTKANPRYVMGADTDASQIYGDTILDSALKDVRKATSTVLGYVAEGKPAQTYTSPIWQGAKWSKGVALPVQAKDPKNNIDSFTSYLEHTLQGNYKPHIDPDNPPPITPGSMMSWLDSWYGQLLSKGPILTFNQIMDSFTGQGEKTAPIWAKWDQEVGIKKPPTAPILPIKPAKKQ